MSKMKIINLSESNDILKNLELEKTIFWVGCGVSKDEPTCLPLGRDLTEFYVKHALGKVAGNEFLNRWNSLSKTISKITNDRKFHRYTIDMPLPRLEFIINCFDDVDVEMKHAKLDYSQMINGLGYMGGFPANKNHYLLGAMSSAGATIVTPNFDRCIEKTLSSELMSKDVPHFNSQSCNIYHYHGTTDNPSELHATIRKIKLGLPKEFRDYLVACFEANFNLFCVGFSASDYFDVTPFFEQLETDRFNGQAIFLVHKESTTEQLPPEMKRSAERMFNAFKTNVLIHDKTTAVLQQICANKRISENTFSHEDESSQYTKRNEKLWQSGFCEPSDRDRKLYLVQVLKRTGLPLDKHYLNGSGYNVKSFLESVVNDISKTDIKSYIKEHYSNDKNPTIIDALITTCEKLDVDFETLSKLKNGLSLDNRFWNESLKITIGQVEDRLKISSPRDIGFSRALIFAFNRLSVKAIQERNLYDIKRLYTCGKKLLSIPFYEFKYISYYTDIQRSCWALLSILNFKDFQQVVPDTLTRTIEILMEINAPSDIPKVYKCLSKIYAEKAKADSDYEEDAQRLKKYQKLVENPLKIVQYSLTR